MRRTPASLPERTHRRGRPAANGTNATATRVIARMLGIESLRSTASARVRRFDTAATVLAESRSDLLRRQLSK